MTHLWHLHYIYSRRYGLQTAYSVFLNSALLFVVLFYVYPLKFLFTLSLGQLSGSATSRELGAMIEIRQVPGLMSIFGLGFAAVFAVFTLLYRYAYSKRQELGLNEYEVLRTQHDMIANAVTCCVGLLVAMAAQLLPVRLSFFSVFLSLLSALYGLGAKPMLRKRERLALERVQQAAAATSSV